MRCWGLVTTLVQLARNRRNDSLYFSKLLIELVRSGGLSINLNPLSRLLNSVQHSLLIRFRKLATEPFGIGDLGLERPDVVLERVEGFDTLALGFVFGGEFLGFADHSVDVFLCEAALFVGDSDRLGLATIYTRGPVSADLGSGQHRKENKRRHSRSLISGRNLKDTIGINLESDLDLRSSTGRRGDTVKLELAQKVVVLGQRTFSLVHLDKDSGLVVGGGGEDLGLSGRNDGVAGDELGEDTA